MSIVVAIKSLARFVRRTLYKTAVNPLVLARLSVNRAPLLLHVGCGSRILSGWLNCDYDPQRPSVFFLNANKLLPFRVNSISAIHCEHVLEHLTFVNAVRFMDEAFRVLQPGGVIRIATPNLRAVLSLVNPTETGSRYLTWSMESFDLPKLPSRYASVLNNMFREWGHQFIWDPEDLRHCLVQAGFSEVKESAAGQCINPIFLGCDNISRMPDGLLEFESIVYEATK